MSSILKRVIITKYLHFTTICITTKKKKKNKKTSISTMSFCQYDDFIVQVKSKGNEGTPTESDAGLHLPLNSVDKESVSEDTSIENFYDQPNNTKEFKHSEENQNLPGQQLIIHPDIHDLTVEEPHQEKQNEPIGLDKSKCQDHTSRMQQKENLVQQTVDARKRQELLKEKKNVLAQPAASTTPPYGKFPLTPLFVVVLTEAMEPEQ